MSQSDHARQSVSPYNPRALLAQYGSSVSSDYRCRWIRESRTLGADLSRNTRRHESQNWGKKVGGGETIVLCAICGSEERPGLDPRGRECANPETKNGTRSVVLLSSNTEVRFRGWYYKSYKFLIKTLMVGNRPTVGTYCCDTEANTNGR